MYILLQIMYVDKSGNVWACLHKPTQKQGVDTKRCPLVVQNVWGCIFPKDTIANPNISTRNDTLLLEVLEKNTLHVRRAPSPSKASKTKNIYRLHVAVVVPNFVGLVPGPSERRELGIVPLMSHALVCNQGNPSKGCLQMEFWDCSLACTHLAQTGQNKWVERIHWFPTKHGAIRWPQRLHKHGAIRWSQQLHGTPHRPFFLHSPAKKRYKPLVSFPHFLFKQNFRGAPQNRHTPPAATKESPPTSLDSTRSRKPRLCDVGGHNALPTARRRRPTERRRLGVMESPPKVCPAGQIGAPLEVCTCLLAHLAS